MALKFVRLVAATALLGFTVTGCDSIRGSQEPVTTSTDLFDYANGCMSDAVVLREYNSKAWESVLNKQAAPNTGNLSTDAAGNYSKDPKLVCPIGSLDRKQYRDMVIGYRIIIIDKRFDEFTKSLHVTKSGIGLGADILDAILDAAGTLFGSKGTKSILSAASGITNAGKDSFDVNIFFKKTVDALIAKMEANRDTVKAAIRKKQTGSDSEYSLDAAIDDLQRIQRAGSIDRAVADLTESAKREATEAQKNLDQVIIERTPADAGFIGSVAGRGYVKELLGLVTKLSDESAVNLAKNPPATSKSADAAAKLALNGNDIAKISPADAKALIRLRLSNAASKAELDKWAEVLSK